MAATPFTATKYYTKSPFILTDRKLSRVVEVAKERFERLNGEHELHEQFEVEFRGGKQLRIDSLESLLSLDNSQKNPVVDIWINFEIKSEKEGEPIHGVQIHFRGKDSSRSTIGLSGISEDLSWLQETMGALEEQLERTIPNDWAYTINKNTSLFIFVTFLTFSVIFLALLANKTGLLHLQESHIEELASLSSTAKSEAEKLDFVFRYLSATLEKNSVAETVKSLSKNSRTYFIGVPVFAGLLSAIVAIFFFYPRQIRA